MAQEQAEPGILKRLDAAAVNLADSVYNAVTRDGTVFAFLRQGLHELGEAAKAFPDAIQITEPGAAFQPLHSTIAAGMENSVGQESPSVGIASPSDIARESRAGGSPHGDRQRDSQPLPSPSEIGREQQPYSPPDHSQQHGQEQGRER